jgi:Smr domain
LKALRSEWGLRDERGLPNERGWGVRPPRRPGNMEIALWAQATQGLIPLKKRPDAPALPKIRVQVPERGIINPPLPVGHTHVPLEGATLDGHWDAQIRRGSVHITRTLDLHGYSLEQAYVQLERAVSQAHRQHVRVLLVITGKGENKHAQSGLDPSQSRGILRTQLPRMLEAPGLRPLVAALRPAHPRHGGKGAWYIILRRVRP